MDTCPQEDGSLQAVIRQPNGNIRLIPAKWHGTETRQYVAAWKHPPPFPPSTHLPQKHQTSLKGMAAWLYSGEHEFFSKKILPNPDNPIYFLPHGRRKAPVIQSGCSSGVERNLAKVDVVGSNPIIRSIFCLQGYCKPLILQSLPW